jgi:DNA damage-inducible protein 1
VPTPSGAHIDSSTGAILDPPPHQQAPQGNFAGPGHSLGAPPPQSNQPTAPQSSQQSRFSEEDIKALTDLGVARAEAIQYLEIAGGNVDAAASMLFQRLD